MVKISSDPWQDMDKRLVEFLRDREFNVVEAHFTKSNGEIREDKRLSATTGYFIYKEGDNLFKREFVINLEEFNDIKICTREG